MSFQDDLQEKLNAFNEKLSAWIEQAKAYFSQLNEMERYGWIGEGAGFLVFIVGIVLFIV